VKRDILCISSIDWDFIWQGHQEIMSTLAAEGHRVVFLENTGVRAPKVRDLPRVRQRIRNWWRGTKGFREERPNLFVYSPLVLPFPYRASPAGSIASSDADSSEMDARDRLLPPDRVDVPADAAGAGPPARDRSAAHHLLLHRRSGVELAGGAKDRAERTASLQGSGPRVRDLRSPSQAGRQFSSNVHVFPFGVSFERFDRVRSANDAAPADLQPLRRPVVGYVGGLHQWVDQELIAAAARAFPRRASPSSAGADGRLHARGLPERHAVRAAAAS
jgi:glycosyltransferase involved in cell wall biosynthesis